MSTSDWTPDALETDVYSSLDLQRARCPLTKAVGADGSTYFAVLGHSDIIKVTGDPRTFSSEANRLNPGERRVPLEVDPPEHTAVRRALQPFFSPKRIAALRGTAELYTTQMLGELMRGDAANFMEFATPYPVRVLCSLMNMPDSDWQQIHEWATNSTSSAPVSDAERQAAKLGLRNYSLSMIADRRAHPQDPESDMTAGLLALELTDGKLSDSMIADALQLMLVAGHLTTTLSLGIVVNRLAQDQSLQTRLRDEPELVPAAVEEILRLEPAVVANTNPRTVTTEVEIAGQTLVPGDRVLPVWSAGNRDPEKFDDPLELRLDRSRSANLTFGRGIHLCIGAPLARAEIEVATQFLLASTSSFALSGPASFRTTWRSQGPTSLPITWQRAGN